MNKKKFLFTMLVSLVGVFTLMRFILKLDLVDRNFAEAGQLNEAALSWFPFERQIISKAKDISMRTNIDTNDYLIRWKFLGPSTFEAFNRAVSSLSTLSESIDCAQQKRPECDLLNKTDGVVLRAEIHQKTGVFEKSIWILDKSNYRVLGSTQIPLPRELK